MKGLFEVNETNQGFVEKKPWIIFTKRREIFTKSWFFKVIFRCEVTLKVKYFDKKVLVSLYFITKNVKTLGFLMAWEWIIRWQMSGKIFYAILVPLKCVKFWQNIWRRYYAVNIICRQTIGVCLIIMKSEEIMVL